MIEATFRSSTLKLRKVQDLVKLTDGRFIGNPFVLNEVESLVAVSFDDSANYSKFSTLRAIINQPYF